MTGRDITTRIKDIRTFLGLKQGEVAERLGITQQAYSCAENSSNLQIDSLLKLAQIFMVHPSFIMAVEVPVTAENIRKYGQGIPANLTDELFSLKSKVSFYKDLLGSSLTLPQSQKVVMTSL